MSGSGGDAGYDYQANAIAYIAAHALSGQRLGWFDGYADIVSSWSAETAGPGDDIAVTTLSGDTIEIQAKHGLTRGPEYLGTFRKLLAGLHADSQLRVVLLVDRHASEVIRSDLKVDIERLGQGRADDLKTITVDLLKELQEDPDPSIFSRCRIVSSTLTRDPTELPPSLACCLVSFRRIARQQLMSSSGSADTL